MDEQIDGKWKMDCWLFLFGVRGFIVEKLTLVFVVVKVTL